MLRLNLCIYGDIQDKTIIHLVDVLCVTSSTTMMCFSPGVRDIGVTEKELNSHAAHTFEPRLHFSSLYEHLQSLTLLSCLVASLLHSL